MIQFMPHAKELILTNNHIDTRGCQALASVSLAPDSQSPYPFGLAVSRPTGTICLSRSQPMIIAQVLAAARVRKLDLSDNHIRRDGFEYLLTSCVCLRATCD